MLKNQKITYIVTVLLLSLGLAKSAEASTVVQFPENQSRFDASLVINSEDIYSILDSLTINSADNENVATSFLVPGDTGSTDLTFTQIQDGGFFEFSFGLFPVSSVAGINPITNTQSYATAAIEAATEIFDDRTSEPGSTATISYPSEVEIGFYLIPNNTRNSFLANPAAFYEDTRGLGFGNDSLRSPLFSNNSANPRTFDQFLSFGSNSAEVTLFTWEDLARTEGSDNSFTDLAFSVDTYLEPVIPEPTSILGSLLLGSGLIWRKSKNKG